MALHAWAKRQHREVFDHRPALLRFICASSRLAYDAVRLTLGRSRAPGPGRWLVCLARLCRGTAPPPIPEGTWSKMGSTSAANVTVGVVRSAHETYWRSCRRPRRRPRPSNPPRRRRRRAPRKATSCTRFRSCKTQPRRKPATLIGQRRIAAAAFAEQRSRARGPGGLCAKAAGGYSSLADGVGWLASWARSSGDRVQLVAFRGARRRRGRGGLLGRGRRRGRRQCAQGTFWCADLTTPTVTFAADVLPIFNQFLRIGGGRATATRTSPSRPASPTWARTRERPTSPRSSPASSASPRKKHTDDLVERVTREELPGAQARRRRVPLRPGVQRHRQPDVQNCGVRMPFAMAALDVSKRDTIRRWIARREERLRTGGRRTTRKVAHRNGNIDQASSDRCETSIDRCKTSSYR